MNAAVLVISDQHFPFNHPDIIAFLRAIKRKYRPDRVINIGDEVDYHSISFHDHDPDLMSPSDELEIAINRLLPLYRMFPKMDLIESNHGSLVYRKAKHHGLSRHILKSYRDILQAPRAWHWRPDLTIRLSDGSFVYFHHGKNSNGLRLSQSMGMSVVQGHYHSTFGIEYWGNPLGLYFSMQVGCLIEKDSLAFAYNRTDLKRPVIGCGIILDGHPKLLPMILKKDGRWNGTTP